MKFPFDEAPDTAAITCCHVLDGKRPILYVSHDADDGMWQFLCGKRHDINEARVISMYDVFQMDASVSLLADMPCGCVAERKSRKNPWAIGER